MTTHHRTRQNTDRGAQRLIRELLQSMGFSREQVASLSGWAWGILADNGGNVDAASAQIQLQIPDTHAFQARFPAYDQLRREGRAMTVGDMLTYERYARQVFASAGLTEYFDTPAEMGRYMVQDVSVGELQARVSLAQQAAVSAPQETRDALERMYGIKGPDLTAAFLNLKKALPVLQGRFAAAEIAGAGARAGFHVERQLGERLASEGVTAEGAAVGFAQIGEDQALFDVTAGESPSDRVSQAEQVGATFEGNAAAKARIERKRAQRTAAFAGNAGFAAGREGIVGLGAPA